MSVFMIAVLLGLLLYQIVVLVQPRASDHNIKVGRRIKVELPAKLYLTVKAIILVAVILTFFGTVILVVAQRVHPTEGYAYRFADALRACPKITESILPQIEKLCWVGFTRMRRALALRG